jgi:2-oxoglutarate dehydrogenase complex dehydrogenase (E1) component-like enzyme
VSKPDLNGVNAAYVAQLLEDYREAPASVPSEWRRVFEGEAPRGSVPLDATSVGSLPAAVGDGAVAEEQANVSVGAGRGLASPTNGRPRTVEPVPDVPATGPDTVVPAAPSPLGAPDEALLGGVAAAMALVKAYRMHGHLSARLDPLGSEPMGDPALDESRLVPALTPALQARIPARLLRLYVPGETLLEALPRLRDVYTGSIAYEIEHISDHAERVWLRQAIE